MYWYTTVFFCIPCNTYGYNKKLLFTFKGVDEGHKHEIYYIFAYICVYEPTFGIEI